MWRHLIHTPLKADLKMMASGSILDILARAFAVNDRTGLPFLFVFLKRPNSPVCVVQSLSTTSNFSRQEFLTSFPNNLSRTPSVGSSYIRTVAPFYFDQRTSCLPTMCPPSTTIPCTSLPHAAEDIKLPSAEAEDVMHPRTCYILEEMKEARPYQGSNH